MANPSHGMFNAANYMNLFFEANTNGSPLLPISVYSDRELSVAFEKIVVGLSNADDWQTRIAALNQLQMLALGDGTECEGFISSLKSSLDLVKFRIILQTLTSKLFNHSDKCSNIGHEVYCLQGSLQNCCNFGKATGGAVFSFCRSPPAETVEAD